MANYKIPKVPKSYLYTLTDLLGVDYNDTVADNRRSPSMTNLVNNNGFLESRHGHKILINVNNDKINGVWNVDANNDTFIVHCGTELYEVNSSFTLKVRIRTGLADVKSSGFYYNGSLIILDGFKALIYHKVDNSWIVDALEDVGYVPVTAAGRKPDGTGGKVVDGLNQLSAWRINQFLADGTSTEYYVNGSNWTNDTPVITQLNDDGTISSILDFTWDKNNGKVTFTTAPQPSVDTGRDNIFIKFKANDITNYINKCTFGTLFGYGGNNNRLFLSGNADFPNVDWYSYVEDFTYFPVDNYAKIGTEPIVGYSRIGDGTLGIHKRLSDTDCTIYYRTYNTMGGMQIFPLSSGVKNVGCINDKCCANFLNDPVFLSELGVYSIIGNASTTNEKFAEERSYYVKRKLLDEIGLSNAVAVVHGTRYYLAINSHVYMADKRFLSREQNSLSSYQYEWFYLDNMPVRVWFTWNNELYWGDIEGNLRTWDSDYVDKFVVNGTALNQPVVVHWESNFLYLDNYVNAKTIRKLFVHHNPVGSSTVKLSYIDADGSHLVSTSTYTGTDGFPKVIQEKEKISKIMSVKLAIDNDTDTRCSFSTVIAEYRIAGKYRGD
jgi:hypothetical protein